MTKGKNSTPEKDNSIYNYNEFQPEDSNVLHKIHPVVNIIYTEECLKLKLKKDIKVIKRQNTEIYST